MEQIPNYLIVLDFSEGTLIKIKLNEDEKQFASTRDNIEQFVSEMSEEYNFSMSNCQWMAADELQEFIYGM